MHNHECHVNYVYVYWYIVSSNSSEIGQWYVFGFEAYFHTRNWTPNYSLAIDRVYRKLPTATLLREAKAEHSVISPGTPLRLLWSNMNKFAFSTKAVSWVLIINWSLWMQKHSFYIYMSGRMFFVIHESIFQWIHAHNIKEKIYKYIHMFRQGSIMVT